MSVKRIATGVGTFFLQVYMLSWLERKAADTLYATPPSATVDEALKHFVKVKYNKKYNKKAFQ